MDPSNEAVVQVGKEIQIMQSKAGFGHYVWTLWSHCKVEGILLCNR